MLFKYNLLLFYLYCCLDSPPSTPHPHPLKTNTVDFCNSIIKTIIKTIRAIIFT